MNTLRRTGEPVLPSRLRRAARKFGDGTVRVARSLIDLKPLTVRSEDLGPHGSAGDWESETIRDHVILVNHAGMPVPLLVDKKLRWLADEGPAVFPYERQHFSEEEYGKRLDRMMWKVQASGKDVAIIVHGGLERPRRTLDVSAKLWGKIREHYYPIFVVWDSWLSAYPEQLLLVRSGRYSRWGPITSPLFLAGDFLTCLGRVIGLIPSQCRCLSVGSRFHDDRAIHIAQTVRGNPGNVQVAPPQYRSREFWSIGSPSRAVLWLVQFPIRILTAVVINGLAPRTWQNLQRRARAMFRAPQEFDAVVAGPEAVADGTKFERPTGAMAVLTDHLAETVKSAKRPIKVTLIAHSMGSMITNEFVEYAGDRLSYDSIVYMAPACSVREFADAVVPVLERDQHAKAYVLTLHPKVEVNEKTGWGFCPRGSILEWIEGFLDPPQAHLDRMLGKFENVMRALHIFPDGVRERIHIKAFSFDANDPEQPKPFKHVHFNDQDVEFWERRFWW